MKQRLGLILLAGALAAAPFFSWSPAAFAQTSSGTKVLINEIKLGGGSDITFSDGTKAKDFIEIVNAGTNEVNLNGWKLEYAKTTFLSANCQALSWAALTQSSLSTELDGTLTAGSVSLPIKRSLNDNESGALRLMDLNGVVQDLVGWGASAPCSEGSPASLPATGKSIERYLGCDLLAPDDTNRNQADFHTPIAPTISTLSNISSPECEPDDTTFPNNEVPPSNEVPPPVTSSCSGVIISEVLPNPLGSDSGQEFIELYNSTSGAISLKNCKLQTSADSKVFVFSDQSLAAKEYKAFYDDITGLTLNNSSGGKAWLLSHADVELAEVDYPADLEDDQAFALFTSDWKKTYSPTPGEANELVELQPCPAGQSRSPETNRCRRLEVVSIADLKPCPPGKERNPLTNRCRSSTSVLSQLKACRPDQVRNPITNRCKKLFSSVAGLKSCASDQFRNPLTNRCKKLASASLKPCQEGQQRNPKTNRCRKVNSLGNQNMASVKDVPAPSISNNVSWLFAGASMVGAVGYAAFEWRRELVSSLQNLKSKFTISGS